MAAKEELITLDGENVNDTFENLLFVRNPVPTGPNAAVEVMVSGQPTCLQLGAQAMNVVGRLGTNSYYLEIQNTSGLHPNQYLKFRYNGTSDVNVPASGTLLTDAATDIPDLAVVGTITTGEWNADIISPEYGGTGVNNGVFTTTLAGNFVTSGAFNTTLTVTADTNVTLPATGTLATVNGDLGTPSAINLSGATNLPVTALAAPVSLAKGGSGFANLQAIVQRKSIQIPLLSGTATIPVDNTIPQNSEGAQLTTLSITPRSATNKLVFRLHTPCSILNVGGTVVVALFNSASANAIAVQDSIITAANNHSHIDLYYEMTAGVTTALTFTVRIGSNNGTWYTSDNALANYGGVLQANSWFEIIEVTP